MNMEMRVKIAKDAIAQIQTKQLIAKHGVYIGTDIYYFPMFIGDALNAFKSRFGNTIPSILSSLKKSRQCNVCALGAMFVSMAEELDSFSVESVADSGLTNVLGNFFTIKELALIELAFEANHMGIVGEDNFYTEKTFVEGDDHITEFISNSGDTSLDISSDEVSEAKAFHHSYDLYPNRAEKRLLAIMNSIVDNNGEVCVSKFEHGKVNE